MSLESKYKHTCGSCDIEITSQSCSIPDGWAKVKMQTTSGSWVFCEVDVCNECINPLKKKKTNIGLLRKLGFLVGKK